MMTNVARKVLKLVQQFYTQRKRLTIAGSQEPIIYDPELCGDIDADVTLYDKDDAPNANSVSPDLLTMLLNRGDIDGRQYVELGDWNFKQRVLRAMEQTRQAQMEQQAQMAQSGQVQQPSPQQEKPQSVPSDYEGMVDNGTVAQRNAERILNQYDLLSPKEATERMREQQNKNSDEKD